jgi:hypothetical protein
MSKPEMQVKSTLYETLSDTDSQTVSEPSFKYPPLERLFDSDSAHGLAEMCSRLQLTKQSLERVVRQGSSEDAARARCVIKSYDTVIGFFTEIDQTSELNLSKQP